MSIDRELLAQVHVNQYTPDAQNAYGDEGVEELKAIQRGIRGFYKHVIAPERLKGRLIFIRPVYSAVNHVPGLTEEYVEYTDFSSLRQYFDPPPKVTCVVQICLNDRLRLWTGADCDVKEISRQTDAIVYYFERDVEHFIFDGSSERVLKLASGVASMFAIPTYRDLKSALSKYREEIVRSSSCFILERMWEDENRILLANRPEHYMRDSLCQYLRNRMRDIAEIQRESNTDESKPVDLEVSWFDTRRLAVIEIKWLGKSVSSSGGVTSYADRRARKGVEQLADYLERKRTNASKQGVVGYLVVIDARRGGTSSSATEINEEEGLYYKDRRIDFDDVSRHLARSDFEPPIRMFAEPRWTTS